jgi:hypothetical protein
LLSLPCVAQAAELSRVFYSTNLGMPNTGDIIYPDPLDAPLVDDAGRIAFVRHYFVSQTPGTYGVYVNVAGVNTVIAKYGQPIQGQPAGAVYYATGAATDWSQVITSFEGGNISLKSLLVSTPPGGSPTSSAAYLGGPFNAPRVIALEGQQAPGLPAGVNYSLGAGSYQLNTQSQVVRPRS